MEVRAEEMRAHRKRDRFKSQSDGRFDCPQAAAEDNGGDPLMRAIGAHTMTTGEINK